MRELYDVAVVGAGPSGATAAYYAASAGLATVLVDRQTFPRSKVCGDGLSPRALRALDRMGLHDLVTRGMRTEGIRILNLRTGRKTSHEYLLEPDAFDFGVVLPRIVLDDEICRAAVAAGAVLLHATARSLETDPDGTVRGVWIESSARRHLVEATITIIADGASGRLSEQLRGDLPSRSRHTAFAIRQYLDDIDGLEPYFNIYLPVTHLGRQLIGYAWSFPVSSCAANIGVGVAARDKRLDEPTLRAVYEGFLDDLTRHDRRYANARRVGPLEGGALNAYMADPSVVPRGAFVVGDAAGLVHAFTGEGIAYALESGELVAHTAQELLRDERSARNSYGDRLRASYPRHWGIRHASEYYRWLLPIGWTILERHSTPLGDALRRLVFDSPRVARDMSTPCRVRERLFEPLRARIVDAISHTDELLPQLVIDFCDNGLSSSLLPLVIPSAVSHDAIIAEEAFVDTCASIMLLSIAEELLASTDGEARNSSPTDDASIVVADRILAEAMSFLARLPLDRYRMITDAYRMSAYARAVRAGGESMHRAYYEATAEPVVCAALVALRANRENEEDHARSVVAFCRWFGTMHRAVMDASISPTADLLAYIESEFGDEPTPPTIWQGALQDLLVDVRYTAVGMLEQSTANRRASQAAGCSSPSR